MYIYIIYIYLLKRLTILHNPVEYKHWILHNIEYNGVPSYQCPQFAVAFNIIWMYWMHSSKHTMSYIGKKTWTNQMIMMKYIDTDKVAPPVMFVGQINQGTIAIFTTPHRWPSYVHQLRCRSWWGPTVSQTWRECMLWYTDVRCDKQT